MSPVRLAGHADAARGGYLSGVRSGLVTSYLAGDVGTDALDPWSRNSDGVVRGLFPGELNYFGSFGVVRKISYLAELSFRVKRKSDVMELA